MFGNIAESLVFLLIKHKRIDITDRDIYIYGLEVILLNGLLLISFLIMSICLDVVFHFCGFLVFFMPLRMFIGGYHAKHSETCFVMSNLLYLFTVVTVKNFMELYQNTKVVIATLFALVIMCMWYPVKNPNRPLADYQYKRNRKITIGIVAIDFALLLTFSHIDNIIASSGLIFLLTNCTLFYVGKLFDVINYGIQRI